MNKRFVWCTDIHLNFLSYSQIDKFALALRENLLMEAEGEEPGGIFITGDISEAPEVSRHLRHLESVIQAPIYFVLGNHDYYRSGFDLVQEEMKELTKQSQFLKWLPASGVVSLNEKTALIGHDGWYDMLNGDWKHSNFYMVDWKLIYDYIPTCGPADRAALSAKITQVAANYLEEQLSVALQTHDNAIVLTHVPPWSIAGKYKGNPTDVYYLPFFTNKLIGEALERVMDNYPNKSLTVLAGHTHDSFQTSIRSNIRCMVGGAEYRDPRIETFVYV